MPAALDAAVRLGLSSKSLMNQHQAIKECIEGLYGINQRTDNPAIFKDYFDEQTSRLEETIQSPDNITFRTIIADSDTLVKDDVIEIDATDTDITLTLPKLGGSKGRGLKVKRIDASDHIVKVKGKSTAKIDFVDFEELKSQGSFVDLLSNSKRWLVFGRDSVSKEAEANIQEISNNLSSMIELFGGYMQRMNMFFAEWQGHGFSDNDLIGECE